MKITIVYDNCQGKPDLKTGWGFSASFFGRLPGKKVNIVTAPGLICQEVFTTGELQGIEQSLAVKTDKGIVVITGCSHPGVRAILDAASRYGEIFGVIGGLHGFHDFAQLKGLSLICPCHCTQYKSDLSLLYTDKYVACGVGIELNL